MLSLRRCLAPVCSLLLAFSCAAEAQEWTRFRGPNGTGESDAATIPATWTAKDYHWRVELPGTGHSSPVVWGDRIYVTSAAEDNATRIICCLNTADGGIVWKQSFPSSRHPKNAANNYAASTPPVDKDHVYMTWATPEHYMVVAMDRQTGREVWRRDLGPFAAEHGFGASPILFGDLLIVPNDQNDKSFIVALVRMTGKTRWQTERRSTRAAYSTPILYQPSGGQPQLILSSHAHGITSLDPATGTKNWELGVFDKRVVGSPMLAAGLIVASCGEGGSGKRMVAVEPGDPAKKVEPKVVYDFQAPVPYVPVPVAYGNLVFVWHDQGTVACFDAPTGKLYWREKVGGKYFGSPVRVRDRLYCMSRDGQMTVLAAADQYKLLGKIDLEEPSHATPAVADGRMYLRTESHLMSIGGK